MASRAIITTPRPIMAFTTEIVSSRGNIRIKFAAAAMAIIARAIAVIICSMGISFSIIGL